MFFFFFFGRVVVRFSVVLYSNIAETPTFWNQELDCANMDSEMADVSGFPHVSTERHHSDLLGFA